MQPPGTKVGQGGAKKSDIVVARGRTVFHAEHHQRRYLQRWSIAPQACHRRPRFPGCLPWSQLPCCDGRDGDAIQSVPPRHRLSAPPNFRPLCCRNLRSCLVDRPRRAPARGAARRIVDQSTRFPTGLRPGFIFSTVQSWVYRHTAWYAAIVCGRGPPRARAPAPAGRRTRAMGMQLLVVVLQLTVTSLAGGDDFARNMNASVPAPYN